MRHFQISVSGHPQISLPIIHRTEINRTTKMLHRRNLLLAPLLVLALHCKSFSCRPHETDHDRRQTRSIGSSSDGHIFTTRLADDAPRNLGNPCGSSPRSSESSMGLGVSGREAELRRIAQNMLAAVGNLNASLVRFIPACMYGNGKSTLPSAPNTLIHLNEIRSGANPDAACFTR